jgi:hypothetical protein
MKRLAVIAALALIAPASAQAAAVEVMVVGKERVLRGPSEVRLKVRSVKVAGRRCRVGAATPLSALAATKLKLGLRDYGRCGRRPRDAAGLYVTKVRGEREKGRGGWVYKVGRRAPSTGAADLSGKRLRDGQRVTWLWCEQDSSGGCQRTLEARPERTTAAPGETLRVTVRGYDDHGRGIAVEGATVQLGSATAVSGADGVAVLTVTDPGTHELQATRDGMVRAFPVEVTVG